MITAISSLTWTDTCTCYNISNLGMGKNAHNALAEVCAGHSKYNGWSRKPKLNTLPAHFVFSAGPEDKGHGHSKEWVKYGTEFAAYIVEHKLGKIVTLPKIKNKKHHPDTYCQVWLWQPDQEAMEAFYNANYKQICTMLKAGGDVIDDE